MLNTLIIIGYVVIAAIVLPIFTYLLIQAGTIGFYRGKRTVKDDRDKQEE